MGCVQEKQTGTVVRICVRPRLFNGVGIQLRPYEYRVTYAELAAVFAMPSRSSFSSAESFLPEALYTHVDHLYTQSIPSVWSVHRQAHGTLELARVAFRGSQRTQVSVGFRPGGEVSTCNTSSRYLKRSVSGEHLVYAVVSMR